MPGRRGKIDWVLDTVVVLRRRLLGPTAGQLKNPYGKLVEPALRGQSSSLLPFVGQPHERAAHFSFSPCKLTTSQDDGCFERPSISELLGTSGGSQPESQPPSDMQMDAKTGSNIHVVKPGETLYRISRRYGVKVDTLRKWNKLPDDIIEVGQKLIVGQE